MIAVLQSPPSSLSCIPSDGSGQSETALSSDPPTAGDGRGGEELDWATKRKGSQRGAGGRRGRKREEEDHLSLSSLLVAVVRKSLVGCRTETDEDLRSMEIGWPTNVQHVAHVTFDRFHGFLGLPVEFEPEVPRRAPSARYGSSPSMTHEILKPSCFFLTVNYSIYPCHQQLSLPRLLVSEN